MWFVYIIYSFTSDVYYKGISQNVERRITEHNLGLSHYTSSGCPWNLVYLQEVDSKKEAIIEERRLKKLNRKSIEKLILGYKGIEE